MRSKHLGQRVVLLALIVYVLHLGFSRQLALYIHPRYNVFTLCMAAIGFVLLFIQTHSSDDHRHEKTKIWSYAPLVVLLGGALLLPARPLSSATVTQRSVDGGVVAVVPTAMEPLNALFGGSSKGLKLTDWARILATNSDESYYLHKTAVISGFIYDANLGADTIWLARFVVTCCAVDAQPVGVPVRLEGWRGNYAQDQWIEVEGEFKQMETQSGAQLVLVPGNVKAIEQPDDPYAN